MKTKNTFEKSLDEQNAFAKVLLHYGMIYDVTCDTQQIICPFHNDTNASLKINLQTCSWICWGCDKHGDALKFIKLIEPKLNDLQVCKKYQKIQSSKNANAVKRTINTSKKYKETSEQLYDESYDYYHGLSKVNWKQPRNEDELTALSYLLQRGLTCQLLNKVKAKVTYQKNYSVIFPMFDNGDFKGWVSRTFVPKIEKKRKYLYNKGFSRATSLVGNYQNVGKTIIVVEGYIDRAKFLQFGENRVVALLGWKATQQQIDKLKNAGVKNIISALDNDAPGKRGTEFLKKYFNVYSWQYDEEIKDPGEMEEKNFNAMYRRTMAKIKTVNKKLVKDFESWD